VALLAVPAGVKGINDIVTALKTLKDKGTAFISRGDNSGTHIAEINLWKLAGIDIAIEKGPWYKDIGQGMGAALNAASASDGYVLSDRGTWLSFKNKGGLIIAVEGDKRLFNQYGVMLSDEAWIDVIQDGKFLRSIGSSGRSDCPGLRKSVRFELKPEPFVLQLSGVISETIVVAIGATE
jgi:ABC-type tungstate transport system permease subunit